MQVWPEELIPSRPVGKMVLDNNIGNFFAEAEQIAFSPAVVVPGKAGARGNRWERRAGRGKGGAGGGGWCVGYANVFGCKTAR